MFIDIELCWYNDRTMTIGKVYLLPFLGVIFDLLYQKPEQEQVCHTPFY